MIQDGATTKSIWLDSKILSIAEASLAKYSRPIFVPSSRFDFSRYQTQRRPPKQNHWAEAFEKFKDANPELLEKLEATINRESTSSGPLQEQIDAVLTTNINTITERQWKIKWGARNKPVREIDESVTKALETAKAFGSAVASLDPQDSLGAAACVLLPVCSFHLISKIFCIFH
jgi:transketolase